MKIPTIEQIEILFFGPGYGESILIHIGYGDWIIVDSCINPQTKKPAVLEYLEQIGLSFDCIKLIIATHWHDDHIRGLYEIVKTCPNADFFLSQAVRQSEFIKLMSYYGFETTINSKSGIQELYNIISFLQSVKKKPKFACQDRILWEKKNTNKNYSCEIRSLSPSDAAILLSHSEIAKLIPKLNAPKRRLPSITPNHASVVLWYALIII
ncbi:MAG: MBL fold metallo-hydrolase [Deltaproteobacteria bacterium]|nr:MBL fold metallo-hydrolase [Deltaproteobacteria bacterium]